MTRAFRVLLLGCLAVLMALAGLAIAAPDSAAQASKTDSVAISADRQLPAGSSCPAGSYFSGNVVAPQAVSVLNGTYCRPDGFTPLQDPVICEGMGMAVWVDQGTLPGVCAVNGWTVSGPDALCPAPTVLGAGMDGSVTSGVWCLFEALIEGGGGPGTAGAPICIESMLVATDAPLGAVGTSFNTGGRDYLIHTGPPTCEVNCHMGFDFNCDDQLGDFCPVELDLNTVVGIHDCLDGFALAEAEAEESAAATSAAPTPPQVIPVPANGTALAQTGSESGVLAYLGFGLIGFGAVAIGLRRKETRL